MGAVEPTVPMSPVTPDEATPGRSERSGPVVSVIVPTYNEAENITELIDRLRHVLAGTPHEIIVADDDSPDQTWQVARTHTIDDPSVRVLRRFEDRGLSSAVLAGMATAEGRSLAVMDGDLQHDETILPQMVSSIVDDGADICVGTRSGSGGSHGQRSPLRRLVTRTATLLARVLVTKTRTTDPLSGYFVISRTAYERIAPDINPRGFKILLEFIGRGEGLRLAEVGYRFRPRIRGETKMSGAIVRNYLIAILDMRYGRHVSPVFLMYCLVGISGVAINLGGFLMGELVDLPRVDLNFAPGLTPIHLSVVAGIELSIISNFSVNNYVTFYEDRYRGWSLLRGFGKFQTVSIVGLLVQVAVFRLLEQNNFPTASMNDSLATTVNNGVGIVVATPSNFFLNATLTWSHRTRARRFTYG